MRKFRLPCRRRDTISSALHRYICAASPNRKEVTCVNHKRHKEGKQRIEGAEQQVGGNEFHRPCKMKAAINAVYQTEKPFDSMSKP